MCDAGASEQYPDSCCPALLPLLWLCFCHSAYTDPFDDSSKQGPELTLVPEVGKPGKVDVQNVYVGKVRQAARGLRIQSERARTSFDACKYMTGVCLSVRP
jgi:hypothetical protein